MAEFDKAWDAVRTALRYTRENQDRKFLSEVLGFSQAFVYLSWGQIEAAVTSAKEGARMASEISYAYIESLSNMVLGYMARLQGDYKSAMSYYQRTIRTGQMSGYPFMVGVGLSGLCATQIDIDPNGNKHSAYDLYQQSAQVLDGPMGLFCGGMMWCDMCDYALAMGDLDSADAMTNKGLTMRTAMANLMRPQLFINAARIALLKGDCNTAEESVKEARAFATKHDMTYFRPMITLMDAEVSMARNDHRQALTKFGQAESLAQTMNLRPVIFKARMGSANLYSTMGRDDEAQVMRDNAHASMLEL
jgi:ATP/maltotriose-dependent transcriptional regulator MalT